MFTGIPGEGQPGDFHPGAIELTDDIEVGIALTDLLANQPMSKVGVRAQNIG